jgi:hypothetical protein
MVLDQVLAARSRLLVQRRDKYSRVLCALLKVRKVPQANAERYRSTLAILSAQDTGWG